MPIHMVTAYRITTTVLEDCISVCEFECESSSLFAVATFPLFGCMLVVVTGPLSANTFTLMSL